MKETDNAGETEKETEKERQREKGNGKGDKYNHTYTNTRISRTYFHCQRMLFKIQFCFGFLNFLFIIIQRSNFTEDTLVLVDRQRKTGDNFLEQPLGCGNC